MKNSTLERAATPASGCQKTLQGGSEGRSPPSCIPNSRCLPQIFDLEKASRARAGQAARFQRAACLADMCGGFGSLAQQGFPARFPGRAESVGETRSVGKDRRRRAFSTSWSGRQRPLQTVEKPMVLERAAFLASFGRSQRSRKMLRHKALGLCPKPRQARREACALWALGPKAQSDPQRGSETMSATVREARMIEQPMIPLHPALCQQPGAGGNARFFIFI